MKINRYAGAFLTGGAICFLCHFLTMAYRMAGVPELFAVSVTVFTLAAVGSVTTITGHYQKLTDFGGMGAMITRKEGMGAGRALWRGVKDGLFILFAGYLAAVVSVVVMYAAGRI